jgi:hypothetical protein
MSCEAEVLSSKPGPRAGRVLSILARVGLILLALWLAGRVAWQTDFAVHPDEHVHLDAMLYFEQHWWPPDLDADGLVYSSFGWSRVYTGEGVYWLYGRIGGVIRAAFDIPEEQAFRLYRSMNVALLGVTLTLLFFIRTRAVDWRAMALLILAVPQAVYIFGYINSDGPGLAAVALAMLATIKLIDRDPARWRWWAMALWGLAMGAVVVSKTPFMLGLIPAGLMLAVHLIRWAAGRLGAPRRPVGVVGRLAVGVLVLLAVAAPLRLVYPATQGDWAAAERAMREHRARPHLRPSFLEDRNRRNRWQDERWAERGMTYQRMLEQRGFWHQLYQSFYGRFGGWEVKLPLWMHTLAAFVAIGLAMWTLIGLGRFWPDVAWAVKLPLLIGPLIIGINVYGVLYHALHIDYQPQGRYLFVSLVPLALLFAGSVHVEPRPARWARLAVAGAMIGISLYAVAIYGVMPSR